MYSSLSCIYLNARSLEGVNKSHNKLVDLQNILAEYNNHIVAITETWLNCNVIDGEILPANYCTYRKDREETWPDKRGGGLLLGIENRFLSKRRQDLECNCEIMVCEVQPNTCSKIAIVLCYRPPNFDKSTFTQFLDEILCKVNNKYKHVCVLGDFNMSDMKWDDHISTLCPNGVNFMHVVDSYSLDQINHVPSTCHGNILDLIFTNVCDLYSEVSNIECDFQTDHAVLCFNISIKMSPFTGFKRTVYNYKKANISGLQAELCSSQLLDMVNSKSDVNEAWHLWLNTVTDAVDKHVPKVIIHNSAQPPWFDKEVRHVINQKKTAWRRARKKNSMKQWAKFRALRNKLKQLLRKKYQYFIMSLGEDCTTKPKRF
jgi:hypothetical protein